MRISIGGRPVGPGAPVYIVAELSGNHNGEIERALALVDAAADAGADAIKLQTYTADTLTIRSDRPDFIVPGSGPWAGRTLYDLYQEAHTPWEWHPRLFAAARARGLAIFSTPFDHSAVELLESLDVPAHKIASFELVDDVLLADVASRGRPVILSTGMATVEEISHAVAVLRQSGAAGIILLKCTSSYPAPDAEMHLLTIPELARRMECVVGLSDHSMGTAAPVAAVALGACFIEKHLTLRRADGGVDSHFSLEPAEFAELVRDVRRVEAMLGQPTFGAGAAETGSLAFRRSLYLVKDVEAGEPLTAENVRSIRPGFGLAPRHRNLVLCSTATRSAVAGTPVTWDFLNTNGHANRRHD